MDNRYRGEGSTDALPIGYLLHWYELLEVIGRGGYGITYLALDRNLQRKVAIKEYLPLDFACRDNNDTVHPVTNSHKELFDWGLQRFLVEARTLAKFNHPAIIRVVSVFEHNNTAYMVMEYEEGDDLAISYLDNAPFTEQKILDIFIPIIEGLALVHDAGFVHRDIKPSNIYIRRDETPVLLDFGSARQTIGSQTRALTSLVTAGYAPFEQYNESEDAQGPWTDIYGLGATIYFCVTGNKPTDAMERGSALLKSKHDNYVPLSHLEDSHYSHSFRLAIDHALLFHTEERPHDARLWAEMLTGKIELPELPGVSDQEDEVNEQQDGSANAQQAISSIPEDSQSTGNQTGNPATGELDAVEVKDDTRTVIPASITDTSDEFDDSTRIYHKQKQAGVADQEAREAEVKTSDNIDRAIDKPVHGSGLSDRLKTAGDVVTLKLAAIKQAVIELSSRVTEKSQRNIKFVGAGVAAVGLVLLVGIIVTTNDSENEKIAVVKVKQSDSIAPADPAPLSEEHQSKIKQATRELVEGLLAQAKLDVASNRIIHPEKNNAVYRYRKVLAIQPDNAEATKGLSIIEQRYVSMIHTTIDEESWQEAKQQIEELKSITGNSQEISILEKRMVDYEKRLKSIAKHLNQADRYYKQNRLTRPKSRNALAFYTKVLELDPGNQHANDGVTKIVEKLSVVMNKQLKSRRFSRAEKTFELIESIDPDAPALTQAETQLSAIVEKRKSIGRLLKSADTYFIRGNVTSPPGKNAYESYRKVLSISPGNKKAKQGIDRIYGYYVSSFYQYLNDARFDKAEKTVVTLKRINYGKKQITILRRMINDERLAAKNEPETIRLMLSQLEKGLKNRDITAVSQLSYFKNKDEKFIKNVFDKYSTYSVKVMQTDHNLKSHQAKAHVKFSNLSSNDVDSYDSENSEIKVDIVVGRNENKEWKITW